MRTKTTPSRSKPLNKTKNDQSRISTYFALTGCALILLSGFFFAGRQHFASMDYGIRNSKLRKQIEDLQAEKRRLLFAKEVSLSPNEIRKAARKAGLFQVPGSMDAAPQLASVKRTERNDLTATSASPSVIKTASVQRSVPGAEKSVQKVRPADKVSKLAASSE
jgi:hypothetical protein